MADKKVCLDDDALDEVSGGTAVRYVPAITNSKTVKSTNATASTAKAQTATTVQSATGTVQTVASLLNAKDSL